MTITKLRIVKSIVEKTGLPRNVTSVIVQAFLDCVIYELVEENRLEFRNFGIFEVIHRKSRIARNPQTNEVVHVPARNVVHFKSGKAMKRRVLDG